MGVITHSRTDPLHPLAGAALTWAAKVKVACLRSRTYRLQLTVLRRLQDVLQAAEGDVNAAAWMLSELHNPVTPGMSPQMSPSMSPWASPLGSPLGSPHISPARSHLPAHLSSPRPPDLATIAELPGQKARPAPNSKQRVQEPAKPAQTSDRAAKAGRLGNPRSRPEHTDSPSSERGRQRRQRSEEEGDAYYSFRGEALQLTRQWQRAAHKATSAFSGMFRCLPPVLALKQNLVDVK